MDKVVRYSSVQGSHDTTGNKNLVDFNIPMDGNVYDLSESYIAINISNEITNPNAVTTTGATDAITDGVSNVVTTFDEGATAPAVRTNIEYNVPTTTACLVRNAQMHAGKKGMVESLRRCDVLRSNLYLYLRDEQELQNNPNGLLCIKNSMENVCWAPQNGTELSGVGNTNQPVPSRYVDHEVRIPLKEVFEFARSADAYDTNYCGAAKIHCEMQFDKLAFADSRIDATNTRRFRGIAGEPFLGQCENMTNGTGGAKDYTTLMTAVPWSEIANDLAPWWVNQKVNLNGRVNAVAIAPAKIAKIKSISVYDGVSAIDGEAAGSGFCVPDNAGKLLIELDGSFADAVANGHVLDQLLLTPYTTGDVQSTSINSVELVAKVNVAPPPPGPISYNVFDLEEDTFPVVADAVLYRYYSLPPGCDCVVLCMADTRTYCTNVYTGVANSEIQYYRATLDNVEMTDRQVELKSPVHYDLVIKALMELEHTPKNLRETVLQWDYRTGAATVVRAPTSIVMLPIPPKPWSQKLGIELTPATGNEFKGHIAIFKHRPAQL